MSQSDISHFIRPLGLAIDSDRSLLVTDQAGCTLKRVSVPDYNGDTSYSVSYVVGEMAVASAANACGVRSTRTCVHHPTFAYPLCCDTHHVATLACLPSLPV
ncbi:hypothetical protein HaLaN_20165, partial [Haematococcus lacustris]